MSDIVERLREYEGDVGHYAIMREAADEIERLRRVLATAQVEMCEKSAQAFEKRAAEIGTKECCGFGLGSPPECCGDPLFMISDRDGAAAIRAAGDAASKIERLREWEGRVLRDRADLQAQVATLREALFALDYVAHQLCVSLDVDPDETFVRVKNSRTDEELVRKYLSDIFVQVCAALEDKG